MNTSELKEYITKAGEEIKATLLPKPGFPNRNPWAHIYGMINALCGDSYSKVDSVKVRAVVDAIKKSPNGDRQEIFQIAKELYKESKQNTKNE